MGRGHLIRPLGGLLAAMLTLSILPQQVALAVSGVSISAVNAGSGDQTDPHLSGDWVSYTDNSSFSIRFQGLDLGAASDRLIPHPDGQYDSLSDISGDTILFMRATDSGSQGIYEVQIDASGNPGPAAEVAPSDNALRRRSVVGGDTIAWEDRGYDSTMYGQPEIAVASVANPAAPAYRLTDDGIADQWPAVSPDGNAVVWVKCSAATACDVWRAERTAGAWGAPEQVTGAAGNESLPDTNGPVTVYGSSAGGDENIRWSVKGPDGYVESVLDLPGVQRNPNITGHFIAFESNVALGGQFDLWLYDLATSTLYQLTDTAVSESLSDVTTGVGGLVRVAWAQPKQVYPYDMDVYALSFIPETPYSFSGFLAPVNNAPITNEMKAGASVAVKFSLGGDQGLDIFADDSPASQQVACNTSDPVDAVEQTVTAGGSSLSYDAVTDQYTYVWKTDKTWSRTCRQLQVNLGDGSVHVALFKFR